jgi:formate dehydrogenase subunit gamma
MIKRHTGAGIFMHWFNAVCWFFLLFTGLALIENPELQTLGAGYPSAVRAMFGGGAVLLAIHWGTGIIWAGVWLLYILIGSVKYVIPFIKDIHTYSIGRDTQWMVKKQLQMTLGYKAMAKLVKPLGWDASIPDQGYYNTGQKVAALGLVGGGLVIVVTGLIMVASKYLLGPESAGLVQWSITLHYLAAGVTFALLLVHIYMAAISKEERPAFFSMFTGKVPAEYAAHHHRLWYEGLSEEEKTAA